MKSTMLTLLLAGSLFAGTAATAQYGAPPPPPPPYGYNPNVFWRGAPIDPYQRIEYLRQRVNRSVADGSLDRREGARVNGELNGVVRWIGQMHWMDAGRLSPPQRARVQARLDQISGQIRWLRRYG